MNKKLRNFLIGLFLFMFIGQFVFEKPNYNNVLIADTVNIYNNGILVKTLSDPKILFNQDYGVMIHKISKSNLYLKENEMQIIYDIDFIKDNETLVAIEVLSPGNQQAIEKIEGKKKNRHQVEWHEVSGKYLVLRNKTTYFSFGQPFFQNLVDTLNEYE